MLKFGCFPFVHKVILRFVDCAYSRVKCVRVLEISNMINFKSDVKLWGNIYVP